MNMESPVRICLGAALVVTLLLISTTVGSALPQTTPNTVKEQNVQRFNRTNHTWAKKPSSTEAANELDPKETLSEEHNEKNAKYKDRGRVKFFSQTKSTTQNPVRRVRSSTEAGKVIIVTPTPEVKSADQIVDSTNIYQKIKSSISTSTTTPVSIHKEAHSVEEYEDEEDEEEKESFERFTSSKFHDNFFTIPSFDDDDNDSSNNKVREDYSSPSYGFSSFFPKESSFGFDHKTDNNHFKSGSFFNFDSELTTPKNDLFDKKYQAISGSIIKKLDLIKTKTSAPNITNVHKIVKEKNVGIETLGNNTPANKSTVFIKNTKEIRLLDNDGASSANKELSDVQGTSIYYEMSVLSTETYAINHSDDDDCDNDGSIPDPTISTSSEEELAPLKATEPTLLQVSSRPPYPDPTIENVSTLASNLLPVSSVLPVFNSVFPVSIQNSVINPVTTQKPVEIPVTTPTPLTSTERVTRVFSSSFSRNRNYSKRLNLTGIKDSPNSVTVRNEISTYKPFTRKFHYTTQRVRPVWMAPKRNSTRFNYQRPTPTLPTTIYSEHFNIKDKFTTTMKPRQPSKSTLTTVSSEIDPVLEGDIGGVRKVVHSQSISDNSIPALWKRGSTKFKTSTATSAEVSDLNELEIPPTSIAWALASLKTPSSVSNAANQSVTKNDDENELQHVGESKDTNTTTESPIVPENTTNLNKDVTSKIKTELSQNIPSSTTLSPVSSTEMQKEKRIFKKTEKLTAESNKALKSSLEPATTEKIKSHTRPFQPSWIPATVETEQTTMLKKEIPVSETTKPNRFESITKLPSGVTTPQDETADSKTSGTEKIKSTTDYTITTIRFSYVPTEPTEVTEETVKLTESTTSNTWHPVVPTRTQATIKDEPITTYRPRYLTTTEITEESSTIFEATPPVIEVSSQLLENATDVPPSTSTIHSPETTTVMTSEATTEFILPVTTEIEEIITETVEPPTVRTVPTTRIATTPITTTKMTTTSTTTPEPTTTVMTTTPEDTTTIVVEVVTEINTEKERKITLSVSTTEREMTSEPVIESNSEENENNNEVVIEDKSSTVSSAAETVTAPVTSQEPLTQPPKISTPEATTEKVTVQEVTARVTEVFTKKIERILSTTVDDCTEDYTTKAVNDLEDLTSYAGDVTTEASSRVLSEESGSGAAVAIAVSTIGVIALVLLIGLLLVVRRRGRRGVYAQRCTPVSLDAYSLDSVSVGHRKGNQRLRASKRSYGNPAYDDEVTSHPMQYSALANFALDIDSISAEFAEIPSVTVRPEEVPPGCEDKNRYSNVLPLPETRVPLSRIGSDPTTEYINANFITGPGNIRNYYIACQAPLSNTVVDFWRMVWEQNSRLVVMLTEYMENGVEKCYEYLPPSEITDNKRSFGNFKIILKKREQKDKYAVSSVQLINMATRTWREVTHLWYFWPAKGVPDDYDSILDFLSEMRNYMKISQTAKEYDEEGVEVIYEDQNRSSFNNLTKLRSDDSSSGNGVNVYSPAKAEEVMRRHPTNGTLGRMKAASEIEGVRPCVVMCASGAGRAALLLALDLCARALAAGRTDVPRAVRQLRTQRPHALSNRHHYILLYKVLSEYGNKLLGGGLDTI